MTNTKTSYQVGELLFIEYISNHTISFALIETTLSSTGNDTSGILGKMALMLLINIQYKLKIYYLASMLKKT